MTTPVTSDGNGFRFNGELTYAWRSHRGGPRQGFCSILAAQAVFLTTLLRAAILTGWLFVVNGAAWFR